MTLRAHPYANKFPMLPEGELLELAESIRANGLRNPVVLTTDGLILDGRNRAAACEQVGVEPETVVYDGDDLAEYVIDCNTTRRNMSTGARAMSTALVLAADGRRDGGRWRRGSVAIGESPNSETWRDALKRAGVVIDYSPNLAPAVVAGDMALDAAFKQADAIRTSAEREAILERERKKREKQAEREQAERDAQIVTDLTQADASKYLELIDAGTLSPASAWASYQEETRKQIEHGIRTTLESISKATYQLAGQTPETFVRAFLPHMDRLVPEGYALTRDRCDAAIDLLDAIKKELP